MLPAEDDAWQDLATLGSVKGCGAGGGDESYAAVAAAARIRALKEFSRLRFGLRSPFLCGRTTVQNGFRPLTKCGALVTAAATAHSLLVAA